MCMYGGGLFAPCTVKKECFESVLHVFVMCLASDPHHVLWAFCHLIFAAR